MTNESISTEANNEILEAAPWLLVDKGVVPSSHDCLMVSYNGIDRYQHLLLLQVTLVN